MTTKMRADNGLTVLLDLFNQEDIEFSESFLRKCYEVQRQFQYDKDRELPLEHLRRLVEEEVARLLALDQKREAST